MAEGADAEWDTNGDIKKFVDTKGSSGSGRNGSTSRLVSISSTSKSDSQGDSSSPSVSETPQSELKDERKRSERDKQKQTTEDSTESTQSSQMPVDDGPNKVGDTKSASGATKKFTVEDVEQQDEKPKTGSRHKVMSPIGDVEGGLMLEPEQLALYHEEEPGTMMSAFLRTFTMPAPGENDECQHKKAALGVMLGVYLPTVQHILGVTVFLRLLWVVGIAGILQSFIMLTVISVCTLLTCISVSAVATNGEVKAGGAYYMLSRNLGPAFGAVVGVLFFLANSVASAMYLVGGVEVILVYVFPQMTIGGKEAHMDTGIFGMMSHNLRIYSSILLLIVFLIVAMGVKFVQLLAPVSLVCVIISVLACFAGGIEKTYFPGNSVKVCMMGDHLLKSSAVLPAGESHFKICDYCSNGSSSDLVEGVCPNRTCPAPLRCVVAFPGFRKDVVMENLYSEYAAEGEYRLGKKANRSVEVYQDVSTGFFMLMGIYFPAVTGILTGANMSGDLKEPETSIPKGTIAAHLTVTFIYFALALLFGVAVDGNVLRDKYGGSLGGALVVSFLAWPSHYVILVGAFLATFGAGLQCMCSAPRILQALAKDDLIGFLSPFAKVTKRNEPFLGLLVSVGIAELSILLGAMDTIAVAVDMFFLTCYAFVNFTCAIFSISYLPNWRPRYRYYHWSLSILGGVLCVFIMFVMKWYIAIFVCGLCAAIYQYVKWRGAKKEWGDGLRGLALSTAQYSIKQVHEKETHPKNFRPQLLILLTRLWRKGMVVDTDRLHLLQFASQLKAGHGLCVIYSLISGNPLSHSDQKIAETIKEETDGTMADCHLRGFSKVIIYKPSQVEGCVSTLIQSVGLGGLRPNTVLLKWPMHTEIRHTDGGDTETEYETFIDKLYAAMAMNMCLMVAKNIAHFPTMADRLEGLIDVYWIVQDGGLCLLIAYLLTQHKVWSRCKIRVIAITSETDSSNKMKEELTNYVYKLRINAEILVVDATESAISAAVVQRTYMMEKQRKMSRRGDDKDESSSEEFYAFLQSWDDGSTTPSMSVHKSSARRRSEKQQQSADGRPEGGVAHSDEEEVTEPPRKKRALTCGQRRKLSQVDKGKIRKMNTSLRLNELLIEHSASSELILVNLPKPPVDKDELDDYLHYLEVLSGNIERLVFVRGTGGEKITTVL